MVYVHCPASCEAVAQLQDLMHDLLNVWQPWLGSFCCFCRYSSVTDLGTPEDAAGRILDQYLNKEFMSTRLGIKRTGEIVSASSRDGPEGRKYYDIEVWHTLMRLVSVLSEHLPTSVASALQAPLHQ